MVATFERGLIVVWCVAIGPFVAVGLGALAIVGWIASRFVR